MDNTDYSDCFIDNTDHNDRFMDNTPQRLLYEPVLVVYTDSYEQFIIIIILFLPYFHLYYFNVLHKHAKTSIDRLAILVKRVKRPLLGILDLLHVVSFLIERHVCYLTAKPLVSAMLYK